MAIFVGVVVDVAVAEAGVMAATVAVSVALGCIGLCAAIRTH